MRWWKNFVLYGGVYEEQTLLRMIVDEKNKLDVYKPNKVFVVEQTGVFDEKRAVFLNICNDLWLHLLNRNYLLISPQFLPERIETFNGTFQSTTLSISLRTMFSTSFASSCGSSMMISS
jgi:hypothetical protein